VILPFAAFAVLSAAPALTQSSSSEAEELHLRQVLSEAGSSPVEFIRALETHLAKFPGSDRKQEMEHSIVKAAIEAKDDRRILLYGERLLADGEDDLQILEQVTRLLLAKDDKDLAERAWQYAGRFEQALKGLEKEAPRSLRAQAQFREELNRNLGRALIFKARAAGNLERLDDAIALARQSYRTYPTAESAREIGLLLAKAGKEEESLAPYADAFTMPDDRNTEEDRARDRKRIGELYRKLHGSEAGLGDLILEAYDRTAALIRERELRRREIDPNAGVEDPMQFTLSGLRGEKLLLGSLRGSVLVLDFWATWCGPCRIQHPMYEKVKQTYKSRPEVVFLSINTDEDRSLVEPFLKEAGWQKTVYFEDGLSRLLRISSIPTTIIVNRRGEMSGRITGFNADRFVAMLVERIEEALEDR
jgi:thiol-disulfide isomerase/thioredoxin